MECTVPTVGTAVVGTERETSVYSWRRREWKSIYIHFDVWMFISRRFHCRKTIFLPLVSIYYNKNCVITHSPPDVSTRK